MLTLITLFTEGKAMAHTYNCKYIEVSALMNLKVDDLLAGIVNQIRLRENDYNAVHQKDISRPKSPIVLIGRILNKNNCQSKSCENMMVI